MGRPKKTLKKPSSLMKKSLKMAHVRHNPYSNIGPENGGNIKNQPTFTKTELDDDFSTSNPKTTVSAEHYLIPQLKNELPFDFSYGSNFQKFSVSGSTSSVRSNSSADSSKSRYLSKPAKSPPKDIVEFRQKWMDEKRAMKSRIESKNPTTTKKSSTGGAASSNQFPFLSRQDLVQSSNRSSNSSYRSSSSAGSFGSSKAKNPMKKFLISRKNK